jgi:hypothetical protein
MSIQATYRIYGLRLQSDLHLPAPTVTEEGDVDLIVRNCGGIPPLSGPLPSAMIVDWRNQHGRWTLCYHTRDGHALEFRLNKRATCVDIHCSHPNAIDDIVAVLLGPALASILHHRGFQILHAAAVVVDGRTILVAGQSGAGKSTLAAALIGQGAALLAEDLAVLKIADAPIAVQPGYPRLRLCADATVVAGKIASDLPRVFSKLIPDDKRWLDPSDLVGGFCAIPAPLGGIYLLAERRQNCSALDIAPLAHHRAALALLDYLYGNRWLRIPKQQALSWCACIASQVPVQIVHAPSGLERISETAEAIIADAQRLATGTESTSFR